MNIIERKISSKPFEGLLCSKVFQPWNSVSGGFFLTGCIKIDI